MYPAIFTDGEENKLEYTPIFDEYTRLIGMSSNCVVFGILLTQIYIMIRDDTTSYANSASFGLT